MHGPNCKRGNFCTVGRRLQEVNVLGGLILPVWGTIEKALSKQVIACDVYLLIYALYLVKIDINVSLCFLKITSSFGSECLYLVFKLRVFF